MPIAPAARGVDLVSDSMMRARSAKRMLLDAAEDPSSELRRRVRDGLISLGGRLVDEDTLRGKVDTWVGDALRAVRCGACGAVGQASLVARRYVLGQSAMRTWLVVPPLIPRPAALLPARDGWLEKALRWSTRPPQPGMAGW
jgi:hypothetical protein